MIDTGNANYYDFSLIIEVVCFMFKLIQLFFAFFLQKDAFIFTNEA